MYRISGTIKGITPLLFNSITELEMIESLPDKPKPARRLTVEQREAIAMKRVFRDKQGIYLRGQNLKASMLLGCKLAELKQGKRGLEPYLNAIIIMDEQLRFSQKEVDGIDARWGRVPPRTGACVVIRRPMLKQGWVLKFGLTVGLDTIGAGDVQTALQMGGLIAGLGSGRPEHGRFQIETWKIEKGKE